MKAWTGMLPATTVAESIAAALAQLALLRQLEAGRVAK